LVGIRWVDGRFAVSI